MRQYRFLISIFVLFPVNTILARIGAEQPRDAYSIARRRALMYPPWAYIFSFEENADNDGKSKVLVLFERLARKGFSEEFCSFISGQELWRNTGSTFIGSGGGSGSLMGMSWEEKKIPLKTSLTKEQLQSLIDKANKHFSDQ
jgi:hypothetical protein